MDIYMTINKTTGYMENIFSNEQSAIAWTEEMTAKTGDLYEIESEEMC
jgi:hypothetical protein